MEENKDIKYSLTKIVKNCIKDDKENISFWEDVLLEVDKAKDEASLLKISNTYWSFNSLEEMSASSKKIQ